MKTEKLDQLIYQLREIKKLINKNKKLSDKDLSQATPRAREKNQVDMGWNAMARIKHEHEAHALAVELGLADKRDYYGDILLYPDNWHKYPYKPREPFK